MYDATLLKAELAQLVGFYGPNDPAYPPLNVRLLASDSGLYVQMIHSLCTIENIFNAAPEMVDDAAFHTWLERLYDSAVVEMVNQFIRQKKLDNATKALIDSLILFDGIGTFNDRIIKSGRFVGFRINLSTQEGLQATISKLGLQLDTAQVLTLYLYHSSQENELASFPVNVTGPSSFNWVAPATAAILKFYEANHGTQGSFYLGYYEDDLAGQAISRNYDWQRGPCGGCGQDWNVSAFHKWNKHINIQAISVPASGINYVDKTFFDESKVAISGNTNWGMNLAITVQCDLSAFYVQNKMVFAHALAMQICLKLLHVIAHSSRINALADVTKGLAMADLQYSTKDSFASQYLDELRSLHVDFSGISSQCMPCMKPRGITMGAI